MRSPSPSVDQLVGAYRLAKWIARSADGTVEHPFGEHPTGMLQYLPNGSMMVMLAAGDRPPLSADDIVGGSEQERAAAFSSYMAYGGTYVVDDDVVTHQITMSMFPNWVGVDQVRTVELTADELVLRSQPFEINGSMVVSELRWARLP